MKNHSFFSNQIGCTVIDDQLAVVYKDGYAPMPVIKQQNVDLTDFKYVGFQNTRKIDNRSPKEQTVGYFLNDSKFESICKRPWNYVNRIAQYKQTFTPDVSCYSDMSLDEQWYGVYLNRLIGAYWQSKGIIVITTIAWGDADTYSFCFSGVEKGSVVAISTIGTHAHRDVFMQGFIEMCKQIEPKTVICYCKPYDEMYQYANILVIEYEGAKARREAKYQPVEGQLALFENLTLEVA
ncbi:MAG: DUF4417 domain-containing protein [Mycoplasmataceae bacterium]|jgi:hypothetical protein|nr:DUF4417 domain-containing protein [Mycoplasmataceae bacterium]